MQPKSRLGFNVRTWSRLRLWNWPQVNVCYSETDSLNFCIFDDCVSFTSRSLFVKEWYFILIFLSLLVNLSKNSQKWFSIDDDTCAAVIISIRFLCTYWVPKLKYIKYILLESRKLFYIYALKRPFVYQWNIKLLSIIILN